MVALRRGGAAVVVAPPGSGKTTALPALLMDAGMADKGEILVLEPRRLATRLAAEYVASVLGQPIGGVIGYTVRHDERRSKETRLRFVTSGVLLKRLRRDPTLAGVSLIIFDEFHERHAIDDVLLAWVRRLRETSRPDLRVIVMSATLFAEPIAAWLGTSTAGPCPILRSDGRAHPVVLHHLSRPDRRPLHVQIAGAVDDAAADAESGDLLVFLPGARAIAMCQSALTGGQSVVTKHRLEVVPLHASLSPEETRDSLRRRPAGVRRVILSTNIAESSVTIDGVRTVIDAGLHNVARTNAWTSMTALIEEDIPRDSAIQRAGRAGRQAPGRCFRLYTSDDLARRPERLVPELARTDLTDLLLTLRAVEIRSRTELDFLDPPPALAWDTAEATLAALGLTESGLLTRDGQAVLDAGAHPRIGRLVLEAARRGVLDLGAEAGAALSAQGELRLPDGLPEGDSDVLALLRAPGARGRLEKDARELAASFGFARSKGAPADRATALREALMHAFPDRVAMRRETEPERLMIAGGGDALLGKASTVRHARWMVAVDAGQMGGRTIVRLASAIEPDWLIDLPGAGGDIVETTDVRWNDRTERVEATETTRYRGLPMDRRTVDARGRPEASRCLREAVRSAGLGRFLDLDALDVYLGRREVAAVAARDPLPPFGQPELDALLDRLCDGAIAYKDLRERGVMGEVEGTLTWAERGRLDALAPERMDLPSGRRAKIEYGPGNKPKLRAVAQHLFGLGDTPKVAGGAVACLVEILAPSQRPVQLTDDLRGFWTRTWPEVRKELRGRYPRQSWPENPATFLEKSDEGTEPRGGSRK